MGFLKKLFGSGNEQNKEPRSSITGVNTPAPLTIQDLFATNFSAVPDDSYEFSRDLNFEGKVYIIGTKNIGFIEAGLFTRIKVFVFDTGARNIFFESPMYTANQFQAVK